MMSGVMKITVCHYTAIVRLIVGLTLAAVLSACGSSPISAPEKGQAQTGFDQKGYEAALKLMKKKKYSEAVSSLEIVIRDNPEYAGPLINLGIAYKELGQFEDAKKALLSATRKNPKNDVAFNELGLVYRKLGEFNNSKRAYKESIDNNSRYSLAYRNMGILCDIYLQDLSCALRNYRKYQSVTGAKDKEVGLWIVDLKKRIDRGRKGK